MSDSSAGDFNGDFVVDAADYVVWRNDANRTQAQYDLWREHFGSTFGGGAGSLSDSGGGTVPEPGSGVLFVGGLLFGGRMLYLNRRIDSSRTVSFLLHRGSEGASIMSAESRRALLCVDLDGTLVATDTLDECLLCLLRHRPLLLFLLPFWLLGGKAHFKERVAACQ